MLRVFAPALLTVLAACAAADDELVGSQPDAVAAGCERVLTVAQEGACRIAWSCGEGGLHTLLCAPGDAGLECACSVGSDPGKPVIGPASGCAGEPYEQAARAICGWELR